MGRKIRRVPANWEHPKEERSNGETHYHPLFDEDFDVALKEWNEGYELWKKGEHPDQSDCEYWEYFGGPPDPEYYHRGWTSAEWYQAYETVSEGTPVTPPFATKEELVNYLVEHGDFWDQARGQGGWNRENAENFVYREYAPTMMIENGKLKSPRDM